MANQDEHAEKLEELRGEYGEVAAYAPKGHGLFVFCPTVTPALAEYRRLQNDLGSDKSNKFAALERYAVACCVYPGQQEARELFKRRPGMVGTVAGRCNDLAGGDEEELGKASD